MHVILVGGTGVAFGVEWLLRLRSRGESRGRHTLSSLLVVDNALDTRDRFTLVPLLMELASRVGLNTEVITAVSEQTLGGAEPLWKAAYGIAERSQGVKGGFFADPKLGAVHGIRSGLLQKLSAKVGGPRPNAPVLVVGSLMGGTGAGLLPLLGKHFAQPGPGVRVLAFLPWFNPEATEGYQVAQALGPSWPRVLRNCIGGLDKMSELVSVPAPPGAGGGWHTHVYVAGGNLEQALTTPRPTQEEVRQRQTVSPVLASAVEGLLVALEDYAHPNEAIEVAQTQRGLYALVDPHSVLTLSSGVELALHSTLTSMAAWNYPSLRPVGTVDPKTWANVFHELSEKIKEWTVPGKLYGRNPDDVRQTKFWQVFVEQLGSAQTRLLAQAGTLGAGGAAKFGEDDYIKQLLREMPPELISLIQTLATNIAATPREDPQPNAAPSVSLRSLTAEIVQVIVGYLRARYESLFGRNRTVVLPWFGSGAAPVPEEGAARMVLDVGSLRSGLSGLLSPQIPPDQGQLPARTRALACGVYTQPYASPLGVAHAVAAAFEHGTPAQKRHVLEAMGLLWRAVLHEKAKIVSQFTSAAKIIEQGEHRSFVSAPAVIQLDRYIVGFTCDSLGLVPHVHKLDPDAGPQGPIVTDVHLTAEEQVVHPLISLEYDLAVPNGNKVEVGGLLTTDEGWTLRQRLDSPTAPKSKIELSRYLDDAEARDKSTLRGFAESHLARLGVTPQQAPRWLRILLEWTAGAAPTQDWIVTAVELPVAQPPHLNAPEPVRLHLPRRCSSEAKALILRLNHSNDPRVRWPTGQGGGLVQIVFGRETLPVLTLSPENFIQTIDSTTVARLGQVALAQDRNSPPRFTLL